VSFNRFSAAHLLSVAAEDSKDENKMNPAKITTLTWREFEELEKSPLPWDCVFVRPFWLHAVTRHMGISGELLLLARWEGLRPTGVAPLMLRDDVAYFLGNPEVCDYQDLAVVPGRESELLASIIEYLTSKGIRRLDLRTLRPDSATLRAVKELNIQSRIEVKTTPDNVSYEAPLPVGWEAYLQQMNSKQRHEVRRKLRRLESAGSFTFSLSQRNGGAAPDISAFLALFRLGRPDKAAFMNETMKAYFGDLACALADRDMLRLYTLELQGRPAATVFCFDDHGVRYLYNSGYDAQFEELSAGLLCKLFSIQAGIEMGCRRYDFLKGAEAYKKRIGGNEVPLVRCEIGF
jgi:CelD/BcsL family acetyltransferase involved in cellulose biosynthesis